MQDPINADTLIQRRRHIVVPGFGRTTRAKSISGPADGKDAKTDHKAATKAPQPTKAEPPVKSTPKLGSMAAPAIEPASEASQAPKEDAAPAGKVPVKFDQEELFEGESDHDDRSWRALLQLSLYCLGVIYGDIGTRSALLSVSLCNELVVAVVRSTCCRRSLITILRRTMLSAC